MPRTKEELELFAQELRTIRATKSELKLCKKLEQLGWSFKFQHIIQPFIVDFYFPKRKVIVELDSPKFHNKIRDASRDLYLRNLGFRILRIKSYRVFKDMTNVIAEIEAFLTKKPR